MARLRIDGSPRTWLALLGLLGLLAATVTWQGSAKGPRLQGTPHNTTSEHASKPEALASRPGEGISQPADVHAPGSGLRSIDHPRDHPRVVTEVRDYEHAPPRQVGGSAPATSSPGCPDPRGCAEYRLFDFRWATDASGIARIPFFVNPKQPWVPKQIAVQATLAAAKVWNDANPSVRFIYMGTTDRRPGYDGDLPGWDGVSVFGWDVIEPHAAGQMSGNGTRYTLTEADVTLNITTKWGWYPCRQANDSCTEIPPKPLVSAFGGGGDGLVIYDPLAGGVDIQNIMTHELGHVLGLDHPPFESRFEQLTMYGAFLGDEREGSTLALGDVLGSRAAYPCRRCDRPKIYAP